MKIVNALWVATVLLWAGCTSDRKESRDTSSSSPVREGHTEKPDSLPWNVEYNSETQKLELKPHSTPALEPAVIAALLNKKYDKIRLEVQGFDADTLVVKVDHSEVLTEQMGSAGAQTYLAEATYSFTENPRVKAVRFEFREGEHASPGLYTRSSFTYFN